MAVRTNSGQYILGISVVYHSAKVPYVIMNWGEGSCAAGRELLPPQPLSQFTARSLWHLKAAQDRAQQGVNHKTNLGKQMQSMGCTVHSKSALVFRTPAHFSELTSGHCITTLKRSVRAFLAGTLHLFLVGSKSDSFSCFWLGFVFFFPSFGLVGCCCFGFVLFWFF